MTPEYLPATVHIVPIGDSQDHALDGNCDCGPATTPMIGEEGDLRGCYIVHQPVGASTEDWPHGWRNFYGQVTPQRIAE